MTRVYRSLVREEQRELTRERILAAFADELAAGRDDFAIRAVASRAGVSVRTVYQHFPNREAQVEALAAWIEEQLGGDTFPETADDLPGYERRRAELLWRHEKLVRAQLATGVASEVRKRRRRRRAAALDAAVATTGVKGEQQRMASALVRQLISGHIALQLKDVEGLANDECTRTMEWVVKLVVDALKRDHLP
jgi:AcrR family transcriptional regulator